MLLYVSPLIPPPLSKYLLLNEHLEGIDPKVKIQRLADYNRDAMLNKPSIINKQDYHLVLILVNFEYIKWREFLLILCHKH